MRNQVIWGLNNGAECNMTTLTIHFADGHHVNPLSTKIITLLEVDIGPTKWPNDST